MANVSNQTGPANPSATQQGAASAVRQLTPRDFNDTAPAGGMTIMTYNADTVVPGEKGKPGQKGMLTLQPIDPTNVAQLRDALAQLQKAPKPGDDVRLAVDGQDFVHATPRAQASELVRMAIDNAGDQVGATTKAGPQGPSPSKLSPFNTLKP